MLFRFVESPARNFFRLCSNYCLSNSFNAGVGANCLAVNVVCVRPWAADPHSPPLRHTHRCATADCHCTAAGLYLRSLFFTTPCWHEVAMRIVSESYHCVPVQAVLLRGGGDGEPDFAAGAVLKEKKPK